MKSDHDQEAAESTASRGEKPSKWDHSPDAGETTRAMTANAVVSAAANVPLLLAAVGLVIYLAFEAGLNLPGTIFGGLGLAVSG